MRALPMVHIKKKKKSLKKVNQSKTKAIFVFLQSGERIFLYSNGSLSLKGKIPRVVMHI